MLKTKQLTRIYWFIYIAITIGLILGTFTSELVIRSFVIYVRLTGWLSLYEPMMVAFIIIIFVIFTLLFAKWLAIWVVTTANSFAKFNFTFILTLLAGVAVVYWFSPGQNMFNKTIVSTDGRFTSGPYPDNNKLAVLKSQGYTTVISLMDPLVLPAEPFLISREKKAAEKYGITLIQIPMLPGYVRNLEAHKKIEALVIKKDNHKYYVHSYYGKDRIFQFMNLVEDIIDLNPETPKPIEKKINTFLLERGIGRKIDNHLVVSPKPTENELINIILTAPNNDITVPIHTIVSLNPEDKTLQQYNLTNILKLHGVNYLVIPITSHPYDANKILSIAKKIKSFTPAVLVYSYYMPPQSIVISGLILSYLTDLPSLPKELFSGELMQGGAVKQIAPNVVAGPRPIESEFRNYLRVKGINTIGYIGACKGKDYEFDQRIATNNHLKWVCLLANNAMIDQELAKDGPWYIYGPQLSTVYPELQHSLGKTMPKFDFFDE